MKSFFKSIIKLYYWVVSPWLGTRCRFVPSCSEYANQALENHGAIKGILLTSKRICRCHPWGGSGYDPVPEKTTNTNVDKNDSASSDSDIQQ